MKTILAACATALFFAAVACSKEDDKKATPVPTATTGAPATVALPASFSTSCAGCHGAKGEGATGPALAAATKSAYRTASSFIAVVRSGKGNMAGFTASQISDAEVTKIHDYFNQ